MRKQPTVVKDTFGEWPPLATMAANAVDWLSNPAVAATLALALALLWTAYASAQNKTAKGSVIQTFAKECGGMLLCVPCWLMPQFIHLPGYEQWIAAGVLLVLGDYLMGSPHVNPTVSYAFVVTGDVSPHSGLMLVAAQMAGGVLAFPLLAACLRPYGLDFGAPAIPEGMATQDAAWNEFMATFLLLSAVFVLCTTRLGEYYLLKQPLVAAAVRWISVYYGATGPAMNPVLPTCYSLLKTGAFPTDMDHYVVYWAAPAVGAAAAAVGWSLMWTSGIFGPSRIPITASGGQKKSKGD